MKKNIMYLTYIVGILAGCFFLFVAMFVKSEDIVTELNNEVVSDGNSVAVNLDSYLSRNFGFRAEILNMYTTLQTTLFGTSPVEDVIVGENGYLFYSETADDYCGTNILSQRELTNIAKTLELMQEYVKNQDGEMLFVVAPNKNSLYDYMPYYYMKSNAPSNWDLLEEKLVDVNYIDTFAIFENQTEELYYKTDSHWNDLGAYYVFEGCMTLLAKEYEDRLAGGVTESCTMVGDLQRMLYPTAEKNENQLFFNVASEYKFITNTRSFEQNYIETYNENGQGSLLMFRDSFANNLVDHFANVYEYGIFDKYVPYDLFQMEIYGADTVVLEITERNLELIQTSMPKFEAPERSILYGQETEGLVARINASQENEWVCISGVINQTYMDENSCIYIKIGEKMYEITPQTVEKSAYGFCGYVNAELVDETVEVIVATGSDTYSESVKLEK